MSNWERKLKKSRGEKVGRTTWPRLGSGAGRPQRPSSFITYCGLQLDASFCTLRVGHLGPHRSGAEGFIGFVRKER